MPSGTRRQQRRRAQKLDLLLERMIELGGEEAARRVPGQRRAFTMARSFAISWSYTGCVSFSAGTALASRAAGFVLAAAVDAPGDPLSLAELVNVASESSDVGATLFDGW